MNKAEEKPYKSLVIVSEFYTIVAFNPKKEQCSCCTPLNHFEHYSSLTWKRHFQLKISGCNVEADLATNFSSSSYLLCSPLA